MDLTVLYKLTYGMYVLGAFKDGRPVGCIVNTCFQVTSENPLLTVSLNKNNYTLDAIKEFKRFSLSIVAEDTAPGIIGKFGFSSSRDNDKYHDFGYEVLGCTPCVKGSFAGRLILEAEQFIDCDTHVLVVARLKDTVKGTGTPMTYSYYHSTVKGKARRTLPHTAKKRPRSLIQLPRLSTATSATYAATWQKSMASCPTTTNALSAARTNRIFSA